MFTRKAPFNSVNVGRVKSGECGVYIIYEANKPVYVGRSRVDVHRRLASHLTGRGNRHIASAVSRGAELSFEYQELMSPEQAEAELIKEIGTIMYYNMRRETDPADWDWPLPMRRSFRRSPRLTSHRAH